MESMKWRKRIRRLMLASPAERRGAGPWIVGLAVFLGTWVAGERDSILAGIGIAALTLALGEVLSRLLSRRKRHGTSD
jgi:hypothetical protein